MSVDPILNEGVDPKTIHQFLNNQEERVLSPTEPVAEDISIEVGDNFVPNPMNEPSKSDWDTTPATSTIKFFGGMVDEE
jgi:hypothetical protein